MKKILALFSAVTFVAGSTLAVSACGVSKGTKIEIVIKTAPEKAEDSQDPLNEYVYNDKYTYSSGNVNYLIGLSAQIASDKIYNIKQQGADWEEFYNSNDWQRGNFASFHYEPTGGENAFSFTGKNGQEFIYSLKNNDGSVDDNKLISYWFITSSAAGGTPTKENIVVPSPDDFETQNKKIITNQGWIHLALKIGVFQIDFDAQINFDFTKITDVNQQPIVMLDFSTFAKPYGEIDFNNLEPAYNKVVNLVVTKP